ncbi:MAG: hypothetical protein PHS37_09700 [Candidatus Omnitrophica bacterium]|nr:hypothetical protein [Candidatus Omnitrophota bacterium]
MRLIKISLIAVMFLFFIGSLAAVFSGKYLLTRLETVMVSIIEHNLRITMVPEHTLHLPGQGLLLNNVRIGASKTGEELCTAEQVLIKVNIPLLIKLKQVFITVRMDGIVFGPVTSPIRGGGTLVLESLPSRGFMNIFKNFSLHTINISDCAFAMGNDTVSKLAGDIYFDKKSVQAPVIGFLFNGKPHMLSCTVNNAKDLFSASLIVKGKDLHAAIALTKPAETLMIDRCELHFLGSRAELKGQVSEFSHPLFLVYGEATINTADLCHINRIMKDSYRSLSKFRGIVHNKISFRGSLDDIRSWDVIIKSRAADIMFDNYHLPAVQADVKMAEGELAVPSFNAHPYKGSLNITGRIDLTKKTLPYTVAVTAQGIDINALIQDSAIKFKQLAGTLNLNLLLGGSWRNGGSVQGSGHIEIENGNLGPMPLLTPMLGEMYGFLRATIKEMKTVEISGGSCDLVIKDRKIATDNLILTGNMVNIYAKGYMDFDTNLNLQAKNELKESPAGTEDWQRGMVEFIASFGRSVSRAYLTGTLAKPKWKFEYFSMVKDSLTGKIDTTLKSILK